MSDYGLQIYATGKFHNAAILVAKAEHIENRASFAPGSSGHVNINNPIVKGTDGG